MVQAPVLQMLRLIGIEVLLARIPLALEAHYSILLCLVLQAWPGSRVVANLMMMRGMG